jgi:beta-mannosidase
VGCYIINETAAELEAKLTFELLTFSGGAVFNQVIKTKVAPFTSKLVLEKPLDSLPARDDCIVVATLESTGKVLAVDTKTFEEPKNLKLPNAAIQVTPKKVDAKTFEITLQSPVYAKAVLLDTGDLNCEFSDNFFDLLPNRQKWVMCRLKKESSSEQFNNALSCRPYPYRQQTAGPNFLIP